MADVFSSTFAAAEQHAKWSANQFAWDPLQLHVLPSSGSPGSASDGAPSDQASEGPGSSSGGQRDQSLGPLPIGWQDSSRSAGGGAGPGTAGGKEAKGATRAPKGPLVCQVESCGHDLSLEKGYYQRYRVCEPHMKLLSLVVNGKPCRFCQQCGRFQELTEFDGNKRSCRARLLQHNARRRKRDPLDTSRKEQPNSRKSKSLHPWSDSSNDADMASGDVGHGVGMPDKSNYSMDSGGDQGVKLRMTSYGHVSPISTGGAPSWPGVAETAEGPASVNQLQPVNQQPLLQEQQHLLQQQAVNVDLVRCFSDGSGSLDEMIDGILGGNVDYLDDPRLALQQAAGDVRGSFTCPSSTFNAGLGMGAVSGGLQYGVEPQPGQLGMGMGLGLGAAAGHSGSALGQGGFNPPSVPASGAWQPASGIMAEAGASASDLAAALNKRAMQQRQLQEYQLLQQQQQQQHLQQQQQQQQQLLQQQQLQLQQQLQQQQQSQFGGLIGRPAIKTASSAMTYVNSNSSVVSASGGYDAGVASMNSHTLGAWTASGASAPASGGRMLSGGVSLNTSMVSSTAALSLNNGPVAVAAPASGTSSFDLARRLVASGGASAQYQSEDLLVRVSIKIANCTPDQLPPDLYQRLRNLLNTADASLVQGFLRPGCTHLVLDLVQAAACPDEFGEEQAGGGAGALPVPVQELRSVLGPAASRSAMIVQTDHEVAMWPSGTALSAKPQLSVPVAELQASGRLPVIQHVSAAAHVSEQGRAVVLVYGLGLAGSGVELFARMQGGYLPVAVQTLVVAGEVASSAAEDPTLAAPAAVAARCTAALSAAGRQATDVLLVTVDGAPGTGLLLLEAQAGPLLSNWRPCLLSTDAGIALELSALCGRALRSGSASLASLEVFVADLGRVLDKRSYYYSCRTAVRTVPEEDTLSESEYGDALNEEAESFNGEALTSQQHDDGDREDVTLALVCVCERLLGWSADAGMAHVSTFLASALRQYGQDVQAILEAPYADGLNVVHRCIRSGSPRMARVMIDWAAASRVALGWGNLGTVGLSPLHLAALVPATWRVLAATPAARSCWLSAAAADGATPMQLQRMLLSRLPPGVVPKELAEVFLEPRPRVIALPAPNAEPPATTTGSWETKTHGAEAAAEAAASGRKGSTAPGMDEDSARSASTPKTTEARSRQHALLPAALSVLGAVLVLCTAAVLFAIQPLTQQYRGPSRSAAASPTADARFAFLQRLAPEPLQLNQGLLSCCSSMLYVGLLGIAVLFLPVKTATSLLSRIHPASACLGAP